MYATPIRLIRHELIVVSECWSPRSAVYTHRYDNNWFSTLYRRHVTTAGRRLYDQCLFESVVLCRRLELFDVIRQNGINPVTILRV